ncbi:MAG: DNA polymerase III subunit gamma/tau [Bacilli bacterium]|nr:DNA polymerase III subunit gamma/tau [Bacilli bacterium]
MYHALYRKYRPTSFDEVVGQNVIVKTLGNAIINNRVSHAYLFSGPRGTGKTSIAKVFAKMLNCENLRDLKPCDKCISCTQINNNQNIDVIEIDAASNNGVDEIREIRNKITLVPTNSKYKIYIVDEVHMLTTQAFNALLKTLEEPPAHAIFIFATTEYYKIPKTILSRCQRFDFKKVSEKEIFDRLKYIADKEKIKVSDDALNEIAILSDDGMRDSISLLDQANSYVLNEITIDDIHEINGTIAPDEINKFMKLFFNKNLVELLDKIDQYDNDGKDIIKITQEIIEYLKNLLIYINTDKKPSKISNYTEIKELTDTNTIYDLIKNFSNLVTDMKKSNNVKILFEIEIIKNIGVNSTQKNNVIEKQIIEEPKKEEYFEVNIEKEEKQEEIVDLSDDILDLKKIRINNALINFSRRNRDEFKKKIDNLNSYILEPKYSKNISLLIDGELKAITDNTFIMIYPTELMANQFNMNLNELEQNLTEILKENYKPIAVSNDEWEIIKTDYAKNKNNYKYIEEPKKKEKSKNESKNNIEEMFDDIIEYS